MPLLGAKGYNIAFPSKALTCPCAKLPVTTITEGF